MLKEEKGALQISDAAKEREIERLETELDKANKRIENNANNNEVTDLSVRKMKRRCEDLENENFHLLSMLEDIQKTVEQYQEQAEAYKKALKVSI